MAAKNDSWIKDKDYKIPDTSSFMKFIEGDNKFRILSSPVMGYEWWTKEDKPVRSKEHPIETPNIKTDKDGKSSINHFWAMVVYDYSSQSIKTLQLTQKGVMKYIMGLQADPDWGSPTGYNITVNRKGSGLLTKYTITASPHSALDPEIEKSYKAMKIDLEERFFGGAETEDEIPFN